MDHGTKLIAAERQRQVTVEGYESMHDDDHDQGELAAEAALLLLDDFGWREAHEDFRQALSDNGVIPSCGWGLAEKHRGDRVRQLVIAGALIAAEIDRLLRARERGE